ncbi:MAG: sugar phosphate nucleotidyltransferase [Sporolactobacillus sp.]
MKGVILAGGKGTRLRPFTHVMNKHLLPVGSFPMIHWPIMKLKACGIHEILIITGKEQLPDFIKILGYGEAWGVRIIYRAQEAAVGISDGLSYARSFINREKFICLLGDNLFEDDLLQAWQDFLQQGKGAKIFLKKVPDPERFGIAVLDASEQKILSITEKPAHPVSNYCVTGIYMYDEQIFDIINQLSPSGRQELEITDVNKIYLQRNELSFHLLPGWWIDAGTHESLHLADQQIFQDLKEGKLKND